MQLEIRPSQIRKYLNVFVYGLPGCGKTWFLLSTFKMVDGVPHGPVIFDAEKGGADDTCLDMGLSGKIPIITMRSMNDLRYVIEHPAEAVAQVRAMPGFKDYMVNCFGFDTINSILEQTMGERTRAEDPDTKMPAYPGSGVLKQPRSRPSGGVVPAQMDYKVLVNMARPLFWHIRSMEYNTIITAHAGIAETQESVKDEKAKESEKDYGGFPLLPGQLKWEAAKLADHYLYMEQAGGSFRTHTQRFGKWNARTRIRKFVRAMEPNFSFPKLEAIYNKAREENAVAREDS